MFFFTPFIITIVARGAHLGAKTATLRSAFFGLGGQPTLFRSENVKNSYYELDIPTKKTGCQEYSKGALNSYDN